MRVLLLILLIALLGLTGWYTYRWYMYGEQPPIETRLLVSANPAIDESEVSEEQVQTHTATPSHARYLSIPKLNVSDARVFEVGLTADGAMQDPTNLSDVVWYNKSATPGSGGVVLLNGHNGGVTRDGVFAQLHTLDRGDVIEVERGDGTLLRYEIRENQSMHLDEVNDTGMSMMMQSAQEGKEALNIITCDGNWVPRYGQFDRRIMLRAVLVE